MTEFTQELRHYCRNPRCRMKLPQPVENMREAFCSRGCYRGFYRFRCLICEEPMKRVREGQQLCGKRKCNMALQAVRRQYATAPSLGRFNTAKTPENKGFAKAVEPERGIEWALRVNQRRIIGPRVVLTRELP